MSKEKPKRIYKVKPQKFGNGAKLKSYKAHLEKDMIVMTKEYFDKLFKNIDKPIDWEKYDKEWEELDKCVSDHW